MDENPNTPDEERGLYPKYLIVKIGEGYNPKTTVGVGMDSMTGDILPWSELHEPAMVMKFSDPYARDALRTYAQLVSKQYPKLSSDIITKLRDTNTEASIDEIVKKMSKTEIVLPNDFREHFGLERKYAVEEKSFNKRYGGFPVGSRAPVQNGGQQGKDNYVPPGHISWVEHLEIWGLYHRMHSGQDAWTIADRGGFGYTEVALFGYDKPLQTWMPHDMDRYGEKYAHLINIGEK